jgi:hypothetical protein
MTEIWAAGSALLSTWLETYLLHSTVLLGLTWALTRFVRLEPGTRDFLWRLGILGGIVTALGAVASSPARTRLADLAPWAGEGPAESGWTPSVGPLALGASATPRLAPAVDGSSTDEQGVLGPGDARPGAMAVPDDIRLGGAGAPTDAGTGVSTDAGTIVSGSAAPGFLRIRARITGASAACRALIRDALPGAGPAPLRIDAPCVAEGGLGWRDALVLVWLLGASLCLAGWAIRAGSSREVHASLVDAGPRPRGLLAELEPHGRPTRLATSPLVGAPCVLPGGVIVLPEATHRELTDAELRAVLAHELAHVARRDVAWSALLGATGALLWLQPLNRLAAREARRASEEVCDDWAVARTGERRPLATSISRVAEWLADRSYARVAVSMAQRDATATSARVRRILAGASGQERRWARALSVAVLIAPIPFLPAVTAPPTPRAAIFVERVADGNADSARAAVGPVSNGRRVFVARLP